MLWDDWPAAINSIFEDSYRTAVRTGVPVSFDAYYPAPLDGWYELRAWPSPDGLSVYFLEVTERRRMQEQAERSAERLAILAQVSAELAGTLDAQAAAAHLPRLVVPALADFCHRHPRRPGRASPRRRLVARRRRRPGALLERYAAVRLESHAGRLPGGPRAAQRRADPGAAGRTVLELLPPGEARDLLGVLDPETAVGAARCAAAAAPSAC